MSKGATYTEHQAYLYLERINFPLSDPPTFPPPSVETLKRLIAGHLHAIPFENLSLHYSSRPSINLEPESIFDKFVNQRKGGYCVEQNGGFATLLRTLGYELYTIGARVFLGAHKERVGGFDHMAVIVIIGDIEYLVDVGFGGHGLTAPLPIYNGKVIEDAIDGATPEQHRIHLAEIPLASRKGRKSWMLQIRRNPEYEWETLYAFEKDLEFFRPDYQIASQNPQSIFLNMILCTKVEFNDNLQAIARVNLVNLALYRRENGDTRQIATFNTEEDRINAFEKEFGIKLSQEEKCRINGGKLAVENFDPHAFSYDF